MPSSFEVMQRGTNVEVIYTFDTMMRGSEVITPEEADALAAQLKAGAEKARYAAKFDRKTQRKPGLF